ncbi:unnamed protein product [Phytophthora fragariaefolia]|uniref:Unnamed protein product n=1 Tax=Phytophthora fragariaefolia TaxID=1490495 RepID=A0A9W6XL03_9STRA|nr:unnamed protein product [Phytophthora fragariaefolia]
MSEVGEGDRSGEQGTVQEEVARLEAERLRRTSGTGAQTSTEQPSSSGDASGTGTTAKVTSAAGRESLRQETMGDLWADEEEDECKDAEEERDGDDTRTEHRAEEGRTVPGEQRDGDAEDLGGAAPGPMFYWSSRFGYDDPVPIGTSSSRPFYQAYVKEEPREVPSRSPSGFIPMYTGTEKRRPNPPMYGWSVGAQPGTYGEWSATVKTEPKAKLPAKKEPSKTATWTRNSVPSSGTAAKKQPTGPSAANRTVVARTSARNAYDLSSMVSNVMKVVPVFYSDTATMEKARDFWELFEAHTAHLPDQSRLLVFRQKIKGRPAERWWNNSTIKTFATLKVRFHNQS